MMDFSGWELNPYRTYGGTNGNKRCLSHDGRLYMVKFFNPQDAGVLSAGAVSEHISCSIANMLGIEAQKTMLGRYTVDGISYPAVACEDFCGINDKLQEFSSVKNWVIDSSGEGSGKNLSNILAAIDTQELVPPEELCQRFWDMFILDAFVGNFDRHSGNFGIIVNEAEQKCRIAPVYDCGSTLFPAAARDDALMRKILSDENEQNARVYEFPCSAMKDAAGRKIRYFDFMAGGGSHDCTEALRRIVPRIDMERIAAFIQAVEGISSLAKDFYCAMLSARKERLLDYCYEKLAVVERPMTQTPSNPAIAREKFLLGSASTLKRAQRRYAELFQQEHGLRHLLNSDTDARIAAIMMGEGVYSKKEIATAILQLSPRSLDDRSYVEKVMAKARSPKFRRESKVSLHTR